MVDDGHGRTRLARILIQVSVGLALGAVAVNAYAFIARIPAGRSAEPLRPVTTLLGASLVLTAVAAALLIVIGVRTLAGRPSAVLGWAVLVTVVAVTVLAFLSSRPRDAAALIDGPFGKPVVGLAQASWILMAVAALSLCVGIYTASHIPLSSLRTAVRQAPAATAGIVVVGLAVSAAVAVCVASAHASTRADYTTAGRVEIPAMPASVGDSAYTLTTSDVSRLVPAGPGFVMGGDDALIAYDGATGAQRWHYPWHLLGQACEPTAIRSTGTHAEAVVIVECLNRAVPSEDERHRWTLTAFDAMTGGVLWMRDDAGRLQGRLEANASGVPVSRSDDLAMLNPLSGNDTWRRTVTGSADCWLDNRFVMLDQSVAYLPMCSRDTLHLFDVGSGEERTVDLADKAKVPPRMWDLVAAEANTLLLRSSDRGSYANDQLWAVEVESGDVRSVRNSSLAGVYRGAVEAGLYPGPVAQTGRGLTATDESFVDLYLVGERQALTAIGISVGMDSGRWALEWTRIGERIMGPNARGPAYEMLLASIAPDGTSTTRPSPCGADVGGLLPVPGAVLAVCFRKPGFEVVGLR